MGENSAIGWTHDTFNPWWGCTRVSPACQFCYAEAFRPGRAADRRARVARDEREQQQEPEREPRDQWRCSTRRTAT